MNTFSTALLVTMSLSYLVCDGAIWDCNGRQEGSHMSWHGASKCANEGNNEYCTGPGRVWYGDGLTWTYKDLRDGERVGCNNGAFGCDPLPLFQKKCYSGCDMFHQCQKTGDVATICVDGDKCTDRRVANIKDPIAKCNCREIQEEIMEQLYANHNLGFLTQMQNDADPEKWIFEIMKNMECKPVLPPPAGVC